MKKRIAIVGVGAQGRCLAQAADRLDSAELVALADSVLGPGLDTPALGLRSQPALYSSLDALLQGTEVDILCISTTAESHCSLARSAIAAGVPQLLIEKPLATSLDDALALAKLVESSSLRVWVNHSRRWSENYAFVQQLPQRHALGDLQAFHLLFGRGGLGALGVHFFDLALWLAASPAARVQASLDLPRSVNRRGAQFIDHSGVCLIEHQNGCRSFLNFSENLDLKSKFLTLSYSAGRVEIDETTGAVVVVTHDSREILQLPTPDFQGADRAFTVLSGLLNGSPGASVADGIAAIEIVAAAYLSSTLNGALVELPLGPEDRSRHLPIT